MANSRSSSAVAGAMRAIRAASRTAVFFFKVFPMLPSRPIDWVTSTPRVENARYPTCDGTAEGDLYLPSTGGPHPGILVCLGVVPFGVEHPQVSVLGKALARAGFAALLYWSPKMRDFQLDPIDIENIPLAYRWLIERPDVDSTRSGLIGTCVGGSFSIMAAASALIRDRIAFLSAYAPYSSMETFARDIASASRTVGSLREPWQVDPLTRKVFIHSVTAHLEPGEAEQLRQSFASSPPADLDSSTLSPDGQIIYALLAVKDVDGASSALRSLPPVLQQRLASLSPVNYLKDIRAPLITLLHDRGDQVIPVGESHRLLAALNGREGIYYTEMQFQHLDPAKGKLPLFHLMREFGKFIRAVYPIFWQSTK